MIAPCDARSRTDRVRDVISLGSVTEESVTDVAQSIRAALEGRDLGALGALLAENARWGESGERACNSREEVLDTFSLLAASGVTGKLGEVATGARGVLCELWIRWPAGMDGPDHRFQVYFVENGLITEIEGFDHRDQAARAAGIG